MSAGYLQRLYDRAGTTEPAGVRPAFVRPAGRSFSPLAEFDQRLHDPVIASRAFMSEGADEPANLDAASPLPSFTPTSRITRPADRTAKRSEPFAPPPIGERVIDRPIHTDAPRESAEPQIIKPDPASQLGLVAPIDRSDLILPDVPEAEASSAAPTAEPPAAAPEGEGAFPPSPPLSYPPDRVSQPSAGPAPRDAAPVFEERLRAPPVVLPAKPDDRSRTVVEPESSASTGPEPPDIEAHVEPAPNMVEPGQAVPAEEPVSAEGSMPVEEPMLVEPIPVTVAPAPPPAPVEARPPDAPQPRVAPPSREIQSAKPTLPSTVTRRTRPMTAAEVSIIGPLARRRRTLAIFGQRRR